MPQCYVRQLPTQFTDQSLPQLAIEPVVNEGSFYLFEPGHTTQAWSGVPANNATVVNLAGARTKAMIGASTDAAVSGIFQRSGGWASTTSTRVEQTGAGGLHGVAKVGDVGTAGMGILLTSEMRTYLAAHVSDEWYFSVWGRVTRPVADLGTDQRAALFAFTNGADGALAAAQSEAFTPAAGASYVGSHIENSAEGHLFAGIGVNGWTGGSALSGAFATDSARAASWGRPNAWGAAYASNNVLSWILYRAYAENLTVSGRTYEQVKQLDLDAYTLATANGGRYAADNFIDPATVV